MNLRKAALKKAVMNSQTENCEEAIKSKGKHVAARMDLVGFL
jgi:hypothetical protein